MSEEIKEKVGQGKFVAYAYKVYDDKTGELLFEAPVDAPDTLVYGVTENVVPGLIASLKDLGEGDKFEVVLPPEAAFGPSYDDNIVELDKKLFERDGKLAEEVKTDAILPMMTQDGMRIEGRVLEIGKDKIKMDFNHPFAGKTVKFDGCIVQVRDATDDELHPKCGGGCCGGCGGDCGDGCGDGCSH